ncbi:MAG TPA: hypothetical protein VLJ17_15840, partial [Xanthobacteraceae bacterium]|nr:hypothetical protein [Xanthobacteraceae bacterium]
MLLVTAVAAVVSASSVAQAQTTCAANAGITIAGNDGVGGTGGTAPLGPMFTGVSSAAGAIVSSIEAANSIFLTQSTAFVSA